MGADMNGIVNDGLKNAVVGRLVEVANRSWGDERRMVVIETEDKFYGIKVRAFVHNWEDAELLVDMMVVIYDDMVYRLGMGL